MRAGRSDRPVGGESDPVRAGRGRKWGCSASRRPGHDLVLILGAPWLLEWLLRANCPTGL